MAPTLKEKGIYLIHKYDSKRKSRLIKIINLQKIPLLSSYHSNVSNSSSSNDGDDNINDDDEKNTTLHKFGMPPATGKEKGNKNIHHDKTKNSSVSIVNGDISVQASIIYEVKNTSNSTTATASEEPSCESRKNSNELELYINEKAQRWHPHSDNWICKNCTEKGNRWHIFNHFPKCKMNKKQ